MDINQEFKEFRDSLNLIEKDELIERLTRAYNSLMLVEVMMQQKMASVITMYGAVRSAQRDMKGERGESF